MEENHNNFKKERKVRISVALRLKLNFSTYGNTGFVIKFGKKCVNELAVIGSPTSINCFLKNLNELHYFFSIRYQCKIFAETKKSCKQRHIWLNTPFKLVMMVINVNSRSNT